MKDCNKIRFGKNKEAQLEVKKELFGLICRCKIESVEVESEYVPGYDMAAAPTGRRFVRLEVGERTMIPTDMKIQDMKNKKDELENQIRVLLTEFQNDTGLKIRGISLGKMTNFDKDEVHIFEVQIEAYL